MGFKKGTNRLISRLIEYTSGALECVADGEGVDENEGGRLCVALPVDVCVAVSERVGV